MHTATNHPNKYKQNKCTPIEYTIPTPASPHKIIREGHIKVFVSHQDTNLTVSVHRSIAILCNKADRPDLTDNQPTLKIMLFTPASSQLSASNVKQRTTIHTLKDNQIITVCIKQKKNILRHQP